MNATFIENAQIATPSQRMGFLARLTDFGKKIGTLRSVVTEAIRAFPESGYEKIEASIDASVGEVGSKLTKTPWSRWLSSISQTFRESTGSLFVAGEKLRVGVSEAHRIGFQVGAKLEGETENPKVAERLVSKLTNSGLYRPGQAAQLNLLNKEIITTNESIATPVGRLEGTVAEVLRLTREMDSLLYADPDRRSNPYSSLSNNDGQMAFYLRDRLAGLIKSYGELKKSSGEISPELKQTLSENSEDLSRACSYAAWNKELKAALGIS